MPSRWLVLKILVCACAVFVVWLVTPVNEMVDRVRDSDWLWLAFAIFLQILLRLLTALRMYWLAILQKLTLTFPNFLLIVFTSSFYSLFLPGALAGGAITFVKYRQYGASSARSLINILVNKGIAVMSILILGVIARTYELFDGAAWVILYGVLLCLVAPFIVRWGVSLSGWSGHVLANVINRRLDRFARKLTHVAKRFESLSQLSWAKLTGLLTLALFQHGVAVASMLAYAAAVDVSVPPATLCWVFSVIFLLALLPISFANIGVREASMIFLLAPYGVSAVEATAWSLVMYTGPLLSAVTGGMLEAIMTLPSKRAASLKH
ncbi:flippase-like domain-containing protein [Ketobacter sp. MCCC 1A13808]|uniref:lysylphosphatidylglycerol synthase transmembrane domain-containing protein n=1 Tax=Ketobacter sp. MCCC 1A13808 TaxID=2602738 RepID=UPI000F1F774E|nr:lysylphosphatidylglycerol synthase transmembrane domain-containing protein [Ketobacter sp. MCCC 1A13808]MVF13804.1 flippase-like domain-containing protein [Ketobacter sp. MCCC 1A13808]RLP54857.1 MAG: UPF0104 family protein [Ketobacter sp.]